MKLVISTRKRGLDDDSYVVYSCFYYICQGIDTKVPALAEFYGKGHRRELED